MEVYLAEWKTHKAKCLGLEQILTWSNGNVNFKGFPEERFLDPPFYSRRIIIPKLDALCQDPG
jgi:hypothetical protein